MKGLEMVLIAIIIGAATALVIIGPKLLRIWKWRRAYKLPCKVTRGKNLTRKAEQFGVKRKPFESDIHLKKRVLEKVLTPKEGAQ